jgi:hypothetical protein
MGDLKMNDKKEEVKKVLFNLDLSYTNEDKDPSLNEKIMKGC